MHVIRTDVSSDFDWWGEGVIFVTIVRTINRVGEDQKEFPGS